jgi:hypothetical protein
MCRFCGAAFPCTAVRLAERAEDAARVGGHVAYTTRADVQSTLEAPQTLGERVAVALTCGSSW